MEFLIVLGGCAFLLGLALIIWMIGIQRSHQGTANWPKVKGRITYARVAVLERETPKGIERTFTPVLRYRYAVAGAEYEASKRNFLPLEQATYTDRRGAEVVVDRYAAGSVVDVFYNPANPQQAVLEIPSPRAHRAVLSYGVTHLVMGALIIALGIWQLS
jgi:hypothetical protein